MMRTIGVAICAIGVGCAAIGQAQSFDVASVKPHPASGDGRIRVLMSGGPGTPDPGRLNYENVTLKNVMTQAFDVKSYQLTTPAWVDSERFDITAKIPQGTTKEQFHIMLQNLLTERFSMTVHREKKELAACVLVVGKNGPKMKVSEEQPAGDPKKEPPPPGPGGRGNMQMGKDGFPEMAVGRGGNSMMIMPGKARLTANAMSMSRFVEMLGNQVDRPVVDATELKGNYDFNLYFEPEMHNMPGRGPMPGAPGESAPLAPEGEIYPTLVTAIQEQLGLKLEAKKASVDLIVIDHLEKTPTEN